jgi:hypothetical protein
MHHQSPHYFLSLTLLDHDAPPGHLFQGLYLSKQPRYKPSVASSLSPTSVAIVGCLPIISIHLNLLLGKPLSTQAKNQLLGAVSLMFEAFASCSSILLLLPAFE